MAQHTPMREPTRAFGLIRIVVLCALSVPAAGLLHADDRSDADGTPPESLEQILGEPLPAESYTDAERCLNTHDYDSVRVLTDELVVFEGRRGRAWINQLRSRCIGLKTGGVLQFELRNRQVCDLDTFRSLDGSMMGVIDRSGRNPLGGMESGTCMLGRFEHVSESQLDMLESALRMRRNSKPVDSTEQAEKQAQKNAS